MLLQVSETPAGMLLAAPLWLALVTILLGLALIAFPLLARTEKGKALAARIPFVQVRVATAVLAVLAGLGVIYAGIGMLFTSALFEPRGVIVSGTFGEVDRVVWSQVHRFEVEELALSRGRATYLVLYLRSGDYVPIGVSGLDPADSVRLQKFVRERVKR